MDPVRYFVTPGGSNVFVVNVGPKGDDGGQGDPGDVSGPNTSTVGNVATFANASGDQIQDSGVPVSSLASTAAVVSALANKVDKIPGKGLSTEDFTTARKDKLDALSLGTFRGTFEDEAQLVSFIPTGDANEGDYAYVVSLVPGDEQILYHWDVVNEVWTATAPGSTPSTGSEIKAVLEATPDYNTLTDLRLDKLNQAVTQQTLDSIIVTLTGGSAPTANVVQDNTTARTLSPIDAGKFIVLGNASPCTITVDNDATAGWTLSPPISFYVQSAIPIVSPGSGVTVSDPSGILTGLVTGSTFTIKKIGPDSWVTVVGM